MEVRKTVTVLFADLAESTSLGERLDPEALRGVLARYFAEMRSALEAHGGTVEKFIGDAVMAVFGVPVAHEDDALRAVRAANQMRDSLSALNSELERDWGARIQMRTGINTGEVVAGDPAAGQSIVTGDAVNVAARLEQAAELGEILIGEGTHRLTRDAVAVEAVEPLELKGKSQKISAFRLIEVTSGPQLARRMDSPLVGRAEELATLQKAFEDCVSQRTWRLASLVGEAGVGKSRLVNDLVESAPARTFWGHCLPYGEGITFWPIAEVVRSAAGIAEADSPHEARAKVRSLVAQASDAADIADRIEAAIGLDSGEGDMQETFWAVRRLLEELAADSPLVVVLEDIHWAEPALLDLIEYLGNFGRDRSVFLLCTARAELREARPDWGQVAHVIELEPLGDDECLRLIENFLGSDDLAVDLKARITDATEGNPLFVEEMLRMFIDDGTLRRQNGGWVARDLVRVSTPGSISALLTARLDQLDAAERAVIQRASIIGRVFWWGAVRDLSPDDERASVGSHLQTLIRKELVRPDASTFAGEDAFSFSHILVRDAAYESLPKRSRAELHEGFASWLERKTGDRITEFEEIAAYHFEQSYLNRRDLGPLDEAAREAGRRAARLLASAGHRASTRGDVVAATNLLSRAADVSPAPDRDRLEIVHELGATLTRMDMARANVALAEAEELASSLGDERRAARAGVLRVYVRISLADIDQNEAMGEAERYVAMFEDWQDDLGISESRSVLGNLMFFQGRMTDADREEEIASTHARRVGDRRLLAYLSRRRAVVMVEGPTPARTGLAKLVEILEENVGNRMVEFYVGRCRARLEAMQGHFDEARAFIARGKELGAELGDYTGLSATYRDGGLIEMMAGDPIAAERDLRAAYELVERVNDVGHMASIAPDLGDSLYQQERFDEALALADLTEEILLDDDVDGIVRWSQLRGKVLAQMGQTSEAEMLVTEAVAIVATTENLDLHSHALLGQAEVLRIAGRIKEAGTAVRQARDLYRQKENVVGERLTESLLRTLAG